MNVIDSSAWLEYFGDGPNASLFAEAIENSGELIVPSLTIFEVFKRICQLKDETVALEAMAVMLNGRIAELTAELSIDAARISLGSGLPMANSIILATARTAGAVLWTQDSHFQGVDNVEYHARYGS